jgi:hypothetical protein
MSAAIATWDDPKTLAIIAQHLQTEALEQEDLALAERLQLEEAIRASSGSSNTDPALPAYNDVTNDTLSQLLREQAMAFQISSDYYAASTWQISIEQLERQDHDFALRLQKMDDDGYDLDSVKKDKRVAVDIPSLESLFVTSPSPLRKDKGKKRDVRVEPPKPEPIVQSKCIICFESFTVSNRRVQPPAKSTSSNAKLYGVVLTCTHAVCHLCLQTFLQSKLAEFACKFPLTCPQAACPTTLEMTNMAFLLTNKELDQWTLKQRQHGIKNKVYCPNKHCSHLMDGDALAFFPGTKAARCDLCALLFCTSCAVTFHYGYTCAEFKKLPIEQRKPEDASVHRLAKQNKWRPCPSCNAIVELKQGCNHIYCLCGNEYCYLCGMKWDKVKKACSSGKCQLWDEQMLYEEQHRHKLQIDPPPVNRPVQHAVDRREEHIGYAEHRRAVQIAPPAVHRAGFAVARRDEHIGYAEQYYHAPQYDPPPVNRVPQQHFVDRNINLEWILEGYQGKRMPSFLYEMMQTQDCLHCGKNFVSLQALSMHLSKTQQHVVYHCCDRIFRDQNSLDRHTEDRH